MSRSFKKSSFSGRSCASSDKCIANRMNRRINRCLLHVTEDDTTLVDRRLVMNVCSFEKDGKQRFDSGKYPEGMRK